MQAGSSTTLVSTWRTSRPASGSTERARAARPRHYGEGEGWFTAMMTSRRRHQSAPSCLSSGGTRDCRPLYAAAIETGDRDNGAPVNDHRATTLPTSSTRMARMSRPCTTGRRSAQRRRLFSVGIEETILRLDRGRNVTASMSSAGVRCGRDDQRPDNSASQPTNRAGHRRLRADPRRGWARR